MCIRDSCETGRNETDFYIVIKLDGESMRQPEISRQYEQYTNLSDEQCALPGSFAVFALGMLGQEWQQLVWDYLDLCDDEHSHLQEKFLREYVKQLSLIHI